MMKRILPFAIVLLLAIPAILVVLYTKDRDVQVYQSHALEFVPEDPVLILESRNAPDLLTSFLQSESLRRTLEKPAQLKDLIGGLATLDSLLKTDSELAGALAGVPILLSLHPSGKDRYGFVLVLETKGQLRDKKITGLLNSLMKGDGKWTEQEYDQEKFRQIGFGSGAKAKEFFWYEVKKYVIISSSQILMESVIRTRKGDNPLVNDPVLRRLIQAAGIQSKATLYLNLNRLPEYFALWVNPSLKKKMAGFQRLGEWAELDLSLRQDALLLSGLGIHDMVESSFPEVFERQEPQLVEVEQIVPGSAGGFIHYALQKPGLFFEDLDKHLSGLESGKERDRAIEAARSLTGDHPVETFSGLLARDLILVYLSANDGSAEKAVMMAGTQSRNQTMVKFDQWLERRAESDKKAITQYRTVYDIDREKSYVIYRSPFERLPLMLGGPLFERVKGRYFSFIGNYLIMADDVKSLQDVIYHFELNKLLASDPRFQAATNLIGSRSNFTLFLIPSRIPGIMKELLRNDLEGLVSENDVFLQEIGSVGWQFHKRDGYFHSFFLQINQTDAERPQTVWESRLDQRVSRKPVFTVNHQSQAKEILVQDEANNLYLINTAGRVLWKLPLAEKIQSEIHQMDIYRNGKLQFLFSTSGEILLIDRNGNHVEGYPVKLPTQATNGVALFDYDQNRNYRMLIACSDRKTYMYDEKGNLVKGWKTIETEGTVIQPAQHFRVGGKDNIVLSDELRIYILDRQGEVKVTPDQQFPVSQYHQITLDNQSGSKGPRLVTTDAEGRIYSVYFDGKVENQEIRKFAIGHFFTASDLNRDGRLDYVFVEGDRLEVYRHDGTLMFHHKFNGKIGFPANIYQFSSTQKKIGVVISEKNDLYLYNDDGTLYKGFPLKGCTPFTIGFLEPGASHFNLIAGSQDQFLYNYRVK